MSMVFWSFLFFTSLITVPVPTNARPVDHALPPPALSPQPPRNTYQQLTFFMSDVIADETVSPTPGRPRTNSQLPFPGPPGAGLFPPSGGTPLREPSTDRVPFSDRHGGNARESATWFPHLSSFQALEFGAVTMVDEELREGGQGTGPLVGRARGIYVTIPQDPRNHMMAMTAKFADSDTDSTIRFFGIHQASARESHVAVIGGTGKYEGANGYATMKRIDRNNNSGTGSTDKSLRVSVFLS